MYHCFGIVSSYWKTVYNSCMNVNYRDFEECDFDDFKDMVFGLYQEDPEGLPIDEEKIRKTVCENRVHPEKLNIVLICADGQTAGYAILVFFWSNEYGGNITVIDELYIKKEYRGKQIAADFIKYQSARENAVALEVETTASNHAAMRLYKRLGFEVSENDRLILML